VKAILVPVEGEAVEVDWRENDPTQWERLVDGESVDFITLREQGLQVLVDGRSMLNGKDQNLRVTWFLKGTGRWLSEVRGTVLIVGVDPDSGEAVQVPDMLAEVMTHPV